MADTILQVENLGKKYLIRHKKRGPVYRAEGCSGQKDCFAWSNDF